MALRQHGRLAAEEGSPARGPDRAWLGLGLGLGLEFGLGLGAPSRGLDRACIVYEMRYDRIAASVSYRAAAGTTSVMRAVLRKHRHTEYHHTKHIHSK